jgi:RNA polymerase sigma-70 factor (ECF subfamily)
MTAASAISVQSPVLAADWSDRRPVDLPSPASDHDLMLAVRDGELDSLGELFERHHGPLYGYLCKVTGQRTAAEDLTQIVFERMLKYRHTYRDQGHFPAWMYQIARRAAADHFQQAAAAPRALADGELAALTDDAPHAAQSAAANDDRVLLHAALARLDRSDREVLLLSRIQGLSFAEVAGILECSVGAAKVRAHRAVRTLRTLFLQLQKETPA